MRSLSLRPPFPSFISSCSQGVRRHLSVLSEAQCYSHGVRHHMPVLNDAPSCMSRMSGLIHLIQTHTREDTHTHTHTHTTHTHAYTQTRRGKRRENLFLRLTIFCMSFSLGKTFVLGGLITLFHCSIPKNILSYIIIFTYIYAHIIQTCTCTHTNTHVRHTARILSYLHIYMRT